MAEENNNSNDPIRPVSGMNYPPPPFPPSYATLFPPLFPPPRPGMNYPLPRMNYPPPPPMMNYPPPPPGMNVPARISYASAIGPPFPLPGPPLFRQHAPQMPNVPPPLGHPVYDQYASGSSNSPPQQENPPSSPIQENVSISPEEGVAILDATPPGSNDYYGGKSTSSDTTNYKTKSVMCHYRDHCLNGSNCKFAHSEAELRGSRLPNINNPEIPGPTFGSPSASSSSNSGNIPRPRATFRLSPNARSFTPGSPSPPTVPMATNAPPRIRPPDASLPAQWSPVDDGINVSQLGFDNPSRDLVNEHIDEKLYGHRSRKRLPVFEEIAPTEK